MTPSNYQRTRWLTLIGTIITQFALGSVYTWSLFNGALSAKLDAPVSQVAFSFGLLSLGLAISSSVAGKLQERFAGIRLLPDRAFQQPDDAVVKRRCAGRSGGWRGLPADAL